MTKEKDAYRWTSGASVAIVAASALSETGEENNAVRPKSGNIKHELKHPIRSSKGFVLGRTRLKVHLTLFPSRGSLSWVSYPASMRDMDLNTIRVLLCV